MYKNRSASLEKENNFEIVCLYIWLDDMIKRCRFNDKQLHLIKLYGQGYTEEDVADIFDTSRQNVNNSINNFCKKIYKQVKLNLLFDNFQWTKARTKNKWKKCSKCEKWKPMTDRFFRKRSDDKGDGYYNQCRECEM